MTFGEGIPDPSSKMHNKKANKQRNSICQISYKSDEIVPYQYEKQSEFQLFGHGYFKMEFR